MGVDLSKPNDLSKLSNFKRLNDKPNRKIPWEVQQYKYLSKLRRLILDNLKANIPPLIFKELKLEIYIKKIKYIALELLERYTLLIAMRDRNCELHSGQKHEPPEHILCSKFVEENLKTIRYYGECEPFLYMISINASKPSQPKQIIPQKMNR